MPFSYARVGSHRISGSSKRQPGRAAAAGTTAAAAARIPGILAYEARVEGVREWPVDVPTLLRLTLYLALPLVSWIGGAFVAMILVAEFVVHYHIDWAKSAVGEHYGFKPDMPEYWHALGLDQTLHQITYLAIAAAWYFLG